MFLFHNFLCFISSVCDGLCDGEISCLRKRLDGLDDRSFSWTVLLLGLELLLFKLGLLSGVRIMPWTYEGFNQFLLHLWTSPGFAEGFQFCLSSCISYIWTAVKIFWLHSHLFERCLELHHLHLCTSFVLVWFEFRLYLLLLLKWFCHKTLQYFSLQWEKNLSILRTSCQ